MNWRFLWLRWQQSSRQKKEAIGLFVVIGLLWMCVGTSSPSKTPTSNSELPNAASNVVPAVHVVAMNKTIRESQSPLMTCDRESVDVSDDAELCLEQQALRLVIRELNARLDAQQESNEERRNSLQQVQSQSAARRQELFQQPQLFEGESP